jgi:hypothetical protein
MLDLRLTKLLSDAFKLGIHLVKLTCFIGILILVFLYVIKEIFQIVFDIRVFFFLKLLLENFKFQLLKCDLLVEVHLISLRLGLF